MVQFSVLSLCFHSHSQITLTAEYFSDPAEMLQEKLSAVTDECMSRVQSGGETDLLPEHSPLGLSTAPTIPSSSEPNQVHMETVESTWLQLLDYNTEGLFSR